MQKKVFNDSGGDAEAGRVDGRSTATALHLLAGIIACGCGAWVLISALRSLASFQVRLMVAAFGFAAAVLAVLNLKAAREYRSLGIETHVLNATGTLLLALFVSESGSGAGLATAVATMLLAFLAGVRDLIIQFGIGRDAVENLHRGS